MRLIDADAKTFPTPYKINNTEHAKGWDSCLNSISQQPTIDAVPVVHGRWITHNEGNPFEIYGECSICHFEQSIGKNLDYCPNCGAKMDEVDE